MSAVARPCGRSFGSPAGRKGHVVIFLKRGACPHRIRLGRGSTSHHHSAEVFISALAIALSRWLHARAPGGELRHTTGECGVALGPAFRPANRPPVFVSAVYRGHALFAAAVVVEEEVGPARRA